MSRFVNLAHASATDQSADLIRAQLAWRSEGCQLVGWPQTQAKEIANGCCCFMGLGIYLDSGFFQISVAQASQRSGEFLCWFIQFRESNLAVVARFHVLTNRFKLLQWHIATGHADQFILAWAAGQIDHLGIPDVLLRMRAFHLLELISLGRNTS
jgi:hypothetical protein